MSDRMKLEETRKLVEGDDYLPNRYRYVSSWSEGFLNILILLGVLVALGLTGVLFLAH